MVVILMEKNELFAILSISLALFVLLNIAIIGAKPDPSQGEDVNTAWVGDWNWGLTAEVAGHWIWRWPSDYLYTREHFHAWRAGGLGVWYIGDIRLESRIDDVDQTTVYGSGDAVWYNNTVHCYHIESRANSSFQNWISQTWSAQTNWAEIWA